MPGSCRAQKGLQEQALQPPCLQLACATSEPAKVDWMTDMEPTATGR